MLFRAETLDAPDDRRAGQAAIPQQVDDRLVERAALVLVALADVDAHEGALADHMPSRTAMSPRAASRPSRVAASDSRRLAPI